MVENNSIKTLPSGATRSASEGKFDYEGFINPGCLFKYAEYLHKHRIQADGNMRDSDNWQKGLSRDDCMKPLMRHIMDAWCIHRGYIVYKEKLEIGEVTHVAIGEGAPINFGWRRVTMMDCLCGILFNTFGYMMAIIRGTD